MASAAVAYIFLFLRIGGMVSLHMQVICNNSEHSRRLTRDIKICYSAEIQRG